MEIETKIILVLVRIKKQLMWGVKRAKIYTSKLQFTYMICKRL